MYHMSVSAISGSVRLAELQISTRLGTRTCAQTQWGRSADPSRLRQRFPVAKSVAQKTTCPVSGTATGGEVPNQVTIETWL